jgi:hypothetical protein
MTDLDLRAGQIHRGLGVVARWPDIALVIPSDASHDAVVDQMFQDLGPAPVADQIVGAVNELLAGGHLSSVAMVVEATGGPLGMAYGPVEILVDGELVLDGSRGGVRQQLPPSALRLTLRAAKLSKAAEPVAPYDLRRGVAPGAGLTLITIGIAGPAKLDPDAPSPPAPPMRPPIVATPAIESPAPAGEPPVPVDDPQDASWPEPIDDPGPAPVPTPIGAPDPEPVAVADAGPSEGPTPGTDAGPSEERDPEPDPILAAPVEAPPSDGAPPPGVRSGRFPETPDDEPQAPAERATPAVEPSPLQVPFRSVVLVGSAPPSEPVPLPLANEGLVPLSTVDLEAGRVEVQGIRCTRQHFNNPSAAHCMVCGLSLLHLSDNLVNGLRPTLGFIVFDDGSTYGLDRSYVIGREPRPPEGSSAQLLVLRDNNETLSRTHAGLRLDDWTVRLVDLGSTNGTYVWDQGAERWNQLSVGSPVDLRSGDTVALGRRTFVFDSVSRN